MGNHMEQEGHEMETRVILGSWYGLLQCIGNVSY